MKKFAPSRIRVSKRFVFVVVLTIVTLFTGLATGFGLFYRLLYILLATVGVAFAWTWLMTRSLEVSVHGRPRQVRAGDEFEETVTMTNYGGLPKYALVVSDEADLPGNMGGAAVSIRWRDSITWQMKLKARTRGLYRLGPIKVVSTDPFNLVSREETFGESESITVYPRTVSLPGFEAPAAQLYGESSPRQRTHNVTPHASSIRDYAPGDSLSRIHWKSTARLGKLISKEFDLGRASEVWIVVDLQKDIQAGAFEHSTDEYGVTIAASLARRYLGAGLPVGLVAYGDKPYFLPAETGAGQEERVFQYLALARAEGAVSIATVLADYELLWGHNTSLVIITPSPRADRINGLADFSRRGVRIAVIQIDGKSFGGAFDSEPNKQEFALRGIPTFHIKKGDDLASKLTHHGATNGHANGMVREVRARI